jgi:hypothetical protein
MYTHKNVQIKMVIKKFIQKMFKSLILKKSKLYLKKQRISKDMPSEVQNTNSHPPKSLLGGTKALIF